MEVETYQSSSGAGANATHHFNFAALPFIQLKGDEASLDRTGTAHQVAFSVNAERLPPEIQDLFLYNDFERGYPPAKRPRLTFYDDGPYTLAHREPGVQERAVYVANAPMVNYILAEYCHRWNPRPGTPHPSIRLPPIETIVSFLQPLGVCVNDGNGTGPDAVFCLRGPIEIRDVFVWTDRAAHRYQDVVRGAHLAYILVAEPVRKGDALKFKFGPGDDNARTVNAYSKDLVWALRPWIASPNEAIQNHPSLHDLTTSVFDGDDLAYESMGEAMRRLAAVEEDEWKRATTSITRVAVTYSELGSLRQTLDLFRRMPSSARLDALRGILTAIGVPVGPADDMTQLVAKLLEIVEWVNSNLIDAAHRDRLLTLLRVLIIDRFVRTNYAVPGGVVTSLAAGGAIVARGGRPPGGPPGGPPRPPPGAGGGGGGGGPPGGLPPPPGAPGAPGAGGGGAGPGPAPGGSMAGWLLRSAAAGVAGGAAAALGTAASSAAAGIGAAFGTMIGTVAAMGMPPAVALTTPVAPGTLGTPPSTPPSTPGTLGAPPTTAAAATATATPAATATTPAVPGTLGTPPTTAAAAVPTTATTVATPPLCVEVADILAAIKHERDFAAKRLYPGGDQVIERKVYCAHRMIELREFVETHTPKSVLLQHIEGKDEIDAYIQNEIWNSAELDSISPTYTSPLGTISLLRGIFGDNYIYASLPVQAGPLVQSVPLIGQHFTDPIASGYTGALSNALRAGTITPKIQSGLAALLADSAVPIFERYMGSVTLNRDPDELIVRYITGHVFSRASLPLLAVFGYEQQLAATPPRPLEELDETGTYDVVRAYFRLRDGNGNAVGPEPYSGVGVLWRLAGSAALTQDKRFSKAALDRVKQVCKRFSASMVLAEKIDKVAADTAADADEKLAEIQSAIDESIENGDLDVVAIAAIGERLAGSELNAALAASGLKLSNIPSFIIRSSTDKHFTPEDIAATDAIARFIKDSFSDEWESVVGAAGIVGSEGAVLISCLYRDRKAQFKSLLDTIAVGSPHGIDNFYLVFIDIFSKWLSPTDDGLKAALRNPSETERDTRLKQLKLEFEKEMSTLSGLAIRERLIKGTQQKDGRWPGEWVWNNLQPAGSLKPFAPCVLSFKDIEDVLNSIETYIKKDIARNPDSVNAYKKNIVSIAAEHFFNAVFGPAAASLAALNRVPAAFVTGTFPNICLVDGKQYPSSATFNLTTASLGLSAVGIFTASHVSVFLEIGLYFQWLHAKLWKDGNAASKSVNYAAAPFEYCTGCGKDYAKDIADIMSHWDWSSAEFPLRPVKFGAILSSAQTAGAATPVTDALVYRAIADMLENGRTDFGETAALFGVSSGDAQVIEKRFVDGCNHINELTTHYPVDPVQYTQYRDRIMRPLYDRIVAGADVLGDALINGRVPFVRVTSQQLIDEFRRNNPGFFDAGGNLIRAKVAFRDAFIVYWGHLIGAFNDIYSDIRRASSAQPGKSQSALPDVTREELQRIDILDRIRTVFDTLGTTTDDDERILLLVYLDIIGVPVEYVLNNPGDPTQKSDYVPVSSNSHLRRAISISATVKDTVATSKVFESMNDALAHLGAIKTQIDADSLLPMFAPLSIQSMKEDELQKFSSVLFSGVDAEIKAYAAMIADASTKATRRKALPGYNVTDFDIASAASGTGLPRYSASNILTVAATGHFDAIAYKQAIQNEASKAIWSAGEDARGFGAAIANIETAAPTKSQYTALLNYRKGTNAKAVLIKRATVLYRYMFENAPFIVRSAVLINALGNTDVEFVDPAKANSVVGTLNATSPTNAVFTMNQTSPAAPAAQIAARLQELKDAVRYLVSDKVFDANSNWPLATLVPDAAAYVTKIGRILSTNPGFSARMTTRMSSSKTVLDLIVDDTFTVTKPGFTPMFEYVTTAQNANNQPLEPITAIDKCFGDLINAPFEKIAEALLHFGMNWPIHLADYIVAPKTRRVAAMPYVGILHLYGRFDARSFRMDSFPIEISPETDNVLPSIPGPVPRQSPAPHAGNSSLLDPIRVGHFCTTKWRLDTDTFVFRHLDVYEDDADTPDTDANPYVLRLVTSTLTHITGNAAYNLHEDVKSLIRGNPPVFDFAECIEGIKSRLLFYETFNPAVVDNREIVGLLMKGLRRIDPARIAAATKDCAGITAPFDITTYIRTHCQDFVDIDIGIRLRPDGEVNRTSSGNSHLNFEDVYLASLTSGAVMECILATSCLTYIYTTKKLADDHAAKTAVVKGIQDAIMRAIDAPYLKTFCSVGGASAAVFDPYSGNFIGVNDNGPVAANIRSNTLDVVRSCMERQVAMFYDMCVNAVTVTPPTFESVVVEPVRRAFSYHFRVGGADPNRDPGVQQFITAFGSTVWNNVPLLLDNRDYLVYQAGATDKRSSPIACPIAPLSAYATGDTAALLVEYVQVLNTTRKYITDRVEFTRKILGDDTYRVRFDLAFGQIEAILKSIGDAGGVADAVKNATSTLSEFYRDILACHARLSLSTVPALTPEDKRRLFAELKISEPWPDPDVYPVFEYVDEATKNPTTTPKAHAYAFYNVFHGIAAPPQKIANNPASNAFRFEPFNPDKLIDPLPAYKALGYKVRSRFHHAVSEPEHGRGHAHGDGHLLSYTGYYWNVGALQHHVPLYHTHRREMKALLHNLDDYGAVTSMPMLRILFDSVSQEMGHVFSPM